MGPTPGLTPGLPGTQANKMSVYHCPNLCTTTGNEADK